MHRAWLLAVARALPESVTLVGFGICKSQFPQPDLVRKNVSFETQSLLNPFPKHYQGSFDLVSIRMVASTLAEEEWELAARNLASLLSK
jgi:chemotaxis methyl-accepting protein methylase